MKSLGKKKNEATSASPIFLSLGDECVYKDPYFKITKHLWNDFNLLHSIADQWKGLETLAELLPKNVWRGHQDGQHQPQVFWGSLLGTWKFWKGRREPNSWSWLSQDPKSAYYFGMHFVVIHLWRLSPWHLVVLFYSNEKGKWFLISNGKIIAQCLTYTQHTLLNELISEITLPPT